MKCIAKTFFFVFLLFSFSFADIINVPADTSIIQGGIYLAGDGDTVLVAENTYYENINFKGKAITVASQFIMDGDTSHISKTIIDGSQSPNPAYGSVVSFASGEDTTSVLSGFTITGGTGQFVPFADSYGGGGIAMMSGGKIIHNKIMHNNLESQKQSHGAGLVILLTTTSYSIIIEKNEFKENSIISSDMCGGGGIYCKWIPSNGYLRIKNNIISDNSVTCNIKYKAYGGGLGVSLNLPTSVNVRIENNIISKNELHGVETYGSGIYIVYWEPGGIVTDEYPSPIICNNIITNNISEDKGAGIGIWTVEKNHQASSVISPQPAIINNTIVNNKANDGSGIFNFDSYPLLMNNIFWNDLSVEGSREIFNDDIMDSDYEGDKINGGELFVYYSDIQGGWEGDGNIAIDPLFIDDLYHLSVESPCIDAGHDSSFFNDIEDNGNAKWPALGTLRNDLGFYGGPKNYNVNQLRDIIDYILDIPSKLSSIPLEYELSQNFPNPFNPSTTIEFTLPKSDFVILKIYNILGEEISTLVNDKLHTGNHTYQLDGGNLASGVYMYRIEAGEFQQVRKMVLIK